MEDTDMVFYALVENKQTVDVFISAEDAIKGLHTLNDEYKHEHNSYSVEPIFGIWELIDRFGDIDDLRKDEWIEEVIIDVLDMVKAKRAMLQKTGSNNTPKPKQS